MWSISKLVKFVISRANLRRRKLFPLLLYLKTLEQTRTLLKNTAPAPPQPANGKSVTETWKKSKNSLCTPVIENRRENWKTFFIVSVVEYSIRSDVPTTDNGCIAAAFSLDLNIERNGAFSFFFVCAKRFAAGCGDPSGLSKLFGSLVCSPRLVSLGSAHLLKLLEGAGGDVFWTDVDCDTWVDVICSDFQRFFFDWPNGLQF